MSSASALVEHLREAVPAAISEMRRAGGPSDEDFARATAFGSVLASKGDVLLFGSRKKGEAEDLLISMIHAIAVLAFIPGGIRLFGEHWMAEDYAA